MDSNLEEIASLLENNKSITNKKKEYLCDLIKEEIRNIKYKFNTTIKSGNYKEYLDTNRKNSFLIRHIVANINNDSYLFYLGRLYELINNCMKEIDRINEEMYSTDKNSLLSIEEENDKFNMYRVHVSNSLGENFMFNIKSYDEIYDFVKSHSKYHKTIALDHLNVNFIRKLSKEEIEKLEKYK